MNLLNLPPGKNPPDDLYVVIEIPAGSNVKYEYEREMGVMMVDRVLYAAMAYPYNYGFVPGTLMHDGDPLDALVISTVSFAPGTVVRVRPIGVLSMEDEEGLDYKLITAPLIKIDPRLSNINSINDLPSIMLDQIKHFFEHYKELEPGKWTKVHGFLGPEDARKLVMKAIERARGIVRTVNEHVH
ncbi:inorganic diphosphatase [Vulcanisaeta thermophila]|uniref:inorganic diphosphatase n=1 Tax=Vulcanisaeta thermophila TaxID=867917 RepID=UPI0008531801|nr:inorganic diphosphatase [Vulcanisaeta thermophila]